MPTAATKKPRKVTDGRKTADTIATGPLSADELGKMDAYWRALNYLAVG
jgi:phosphoketolase